MTANDNLEYDDLSDLSPHEMESVREWEMQFKGENLSSSLKRNYLKFFFIFVEKYELVGKLLKPGEQATNYSDLEDEPGSSDKSGAEEKIDDKKEDDKKPEE